MKNFAAFSLAFVLFTSAANAYRYIIDKPYGATTWSAGTSGNVITWHSDASIGPAPNAAEKLGLWLYNKTTNTEIPIATNITESDVSYSWTIPSTIMTISEYSIKIGDPKWSNSTYFNYGGIFSIGAAQATNTSSTVSTVTTTSQASYIPSQGSHATERLTYTALLAVLSAVVIGTFGFV